MIFSGSFDDNGSGWYKVNNVHDYIKWDSIKLRRTAFVLQVYDKS
jgi:hypothetical protein